MYQAIFKELASDKKVVDVAGIFLSFFFFSFFFER